MIKEGKFGVQEAICLITIVITTRVFFTSPGVLVSYVGTAGWYMTLISAAAAMLGFTFIYLLARKFPDKNIIEIFEISFGGFLGGFFSLLIAAMFVYESSIRLREFTEVLKVYVMPMSPPSYIIGLSLTGVIVFCFLGLESIVRFSKLFAYILLFGFLLVIALGWQNYEIHRIFPIFGYGIKSTVYHGLARSSVYGDVLILAVVAGSLQGISHIKKAGYISILLSGVLISIAILAFTLTFPYYAAAEITSPMYQLTTMIDYGGFFQRLDPIFLFLWNLCTLISVTTEVYIAISIYCKVFRIQDIRPVVFPFSIIVFSVAMLPQSISEIATGYVQKAREILWVIFYMPALIGLLVCRIRKVGGEKNA